MVRGQGHKGEKQKSVETNKEQPERQEENLDAVLSWKPSEEGVQGGENEQLHQMLLTNSRGCELKTSQ